MTLLQALNVTRVYHNIDMKRYNKEGGSDLSLFISDLSAYDRFEIEKALSEIYPLVIFQIDKKTKKETITNESLTETFNIFLNQLSAFLNSVNDQCEVVETGEKRFDAILNESQKTELKQDVCSDYENLIDCVLNYKNFGFIIDGSLHIQDLQFMAIRNVKNHYKQEIARLEVDGGLDAYHIKRYNTTEHTVANLKALLNYSIKSKK